MTDLALSHWLSTSSSNQAIFAWISRCLWFAPELPTATDGHVLAFFALDSSPSPYVLTLFEVHFSDDRKRTYVLGLSLSHSPTNSNLVAQIPYETTSNGLFAIDASSDPAFARLILRACLVPDHSLSGLRSCPSPSWNNLCRDLDNLPVARQLVGEQTNRSFFFGDSYVLKVLRVVDPEISPEVEIGEHCSSSACPAPCPDYLGSLALELPGQGVCTLAIVHSYVASSGDLWRSTIRFLLSAYKAVDLGETASPTYDYAPVASKLGQTTAKLHLSLLSDHDPLFMPEPVNLSYQSHFQKYLQDLAAQAFSSLEASAANSPSDLVCSLLDHRSALNQLIAKLLDSPITGYRIRCHGDFHLGQVLACGDRLVVVDFEGEPSRNAADRKRKRLAQADLAGMLRSFDYASYKSLLDYSAHSNPNSELLRAFASSWVDDASREFLDAYRSEVSGVLLESHEEGLRNLRLCYLEKVLHEVLYEAAHRPAWLEIPVRGLLRLIREGLPGLMA